IAEQSRTVQSFAGTTVEAKRPKQLQVRAPDVNGALKLAGHQAARTNFFADAPRGLVFTNGFVTVTSKGVELLAHAPENRARFSYLFPYAGPAQAPLFMTFLRALFRDDQDCEEKILLLQEFFGASLLGIAPTYQR